MKIRLMLFVVVLPTMFLRAQTQQLSDIDEREIKLEIKYLIEEMSMDFAQNNTSDYLNHWTYPCAYQFDGNISTFENEKDFGNFIKEFRESLPKSYERSMIATADFKIVSENHAYASIMWSRIMEGKPGQYFGDIYTLVKQNESWKVIQASAYEGPEAIQFE